jgi:hypothetical protein
MMTLCFRTARSKRAAYRGPFRGNNIIFNCKLDLKLQTYDEWPA